MLFFIKTIIQKNPQCGFFAPLSNWTKMLIFYLSNETTIFERQLIFLILILEKIIPKIYLFIYLPYLPYYVRTYLTLFRLLG
jgi:hypothetical protein